MSANTNYRRYVAVCTIIITYFATAFLTGGHYYNHRASNALIPALEAIYAGAFWPAYWAGRVAIKVTK
jgi:hypothetical protein